MTVEEAVILVEYNAWANHRVVASCATLDSGQFARDLGSSFYSVRDTLVHIMGVEWLYMERWHGRSPNKFPSGGEFPTLDSLRPQWASVEGEWLSRCRALSPQDLDDRIEFRNTRGILYAQPLAQLVQHLVNHSTYHRGQIATLLRQLGRQSEATDLIAFYRERDTNSVS
jgi:uncharacterized damage-inducible protein DinB